MATLNATNTPQLTTNGQLIIGSTGANPVAATLTAGTNVTITNGAGSITVAQSAGGSGALTLISSVAASNSATVNFDNQLSATYDNYIVIFESVVSVTNNVTLSCDIGTTSTPTYQTSNYAGGGGAVGSTGSYVGVTASTTTITLLYGSTSSGYGTGLSNVSSDFASGFVYLFNTQNASGAKNFYSYLGGRLYSQAGGGVASGVSSQGSVSWNTNTVLTSIRFKASSGNISKGTFKLYGISN